MKSGLLFIFVFISSFLMAQESSVSKTRGQTSFYAEIGGPGILFSANIDRRFTKSHLGIGGRIGIGFVNGESYEYNNGNYDYNKKSVVTLPIQINYIFGKRTSPHSFEVGAGVTFAGEKVEVMNFYGEDATNIFGTASFMYRWQPTDGGFSFRLGFTPLISGGYVQPFGGTSFGYSF